MSQDQSLLGALHGWLPCSRQLALGCLIISVVCAEVPSRRGNAAGHPRPWADPGVRILEDARHMSDFDARFLEVDNPLLEAALESGEVSRGEVQEPAGQKGEKPASGGLADTIAALRSEVARTAQEAKDSAKDLLSAKNSTTTIAPPSPQPQSTSTSKAAEFVQGYVMPKAGPQKAEHQHHRSEPTLSPPTGGPGASENDFELPEVAELPEGDAPIHGKEECGEDSPGGSFGSGLPWPEWPPNPPEPSELSGEEIPFVHPPLPEWPDWPQTYPEPPSLGEHKGGLKVEDILSPEAMKLLRQEEQKEAVPEREHTAPGFWRQQPIDVANISETLLCSQQDVVWEPLDMVPFTREDNVSACQARCAKTSGCAHFAFWLPGNDCHLQNAFSRPTFSRLGFVSGPPGCAVNQRSKELITIILKKKVCFEEDAQYMSIDSVGTMPRFVSTVLHCQQECRGAISSAHFTYNSLTGLCHCESANSQKVKHMNFYVTGPVRCQPVVSFSMELDGVDWEDLRRNGGKLYSFEVAIASAVAAQAGGQITTDNIGVVLAGKSTSSVEVLVNPPNEVSSSLVLKELQQTKELKSKVERSVNRLGNSGVGPLGRINIRVSDVSKFNLEDDDEIMVQKYSDQPGLVIPKLWQTAGFMEFTVLLGALSTAALMGLRMKACTRPARTMREAEVQLAVRRPYGFGRTYLMSGQPEPIGWGELLGDEDDEEIATDEHVRGPRGWLAVATT